MLFRDQRREREQEILRSVLKNLYAARDMLARTLEDEQHAPTQERNGLRDAFAEVELAIDAAERQLD